MNKPILQTQKEIYSSIMSFVGTFDHPSALLLVRKLFKKKPMISSKFKQSLQNNQTFLIKQDKSKNILGNSGKNFFNVNETQSNSLSNNQSNCANLNLQKNFHIKKIDNRVNQGNQNILKSNSNLSNQSNHSMPCNSNQNQMNNSKQIFHCVNSNSQNAAFPKASFGVDNSLPKNNPFYLDQQIRTNLNLMRILESGKIPIPIDNSNVNNINRNMMTSRSIPPENEELKNSQLNSILKGSPAMNMMSGDFNRQHSMMNNYFKGEPKQNIPTLNYMSYENALRMQGEVAKRESGGMMGGSIYEDQRAYHNDFNGDRYSQKPSYSGRFNNSNLYIHGQSSINSQNIQNMVDPDEEKSLPKKILYRDNYLDLLIEAHDQMKDPKKMEEIESEFKNIDTAILLTDASYNPPFEKDKIKPNTGIPHSSMTQLIHGKLVKQCENKACTYSESKKGGSRNWQKIKLPNKRSIQVCHLCYKAYKNKQYCFYCGIIYKDLYYHQIEKTWVECDYCKVWQHIECEEAKGHYKDLMKNINENKNFKYMCNFCRQKDHTKKRLSWTQRKSSEVESSQPTKLLGKKSKNAYSNDMFEYQKSTNRSKKQEVKLNPGK